MASILFKSNIRPLYYRRWFLRALPKVISDLEFRACGCCNTMIQENILQVTQLGTTLKLAILPNFHFQTGRRMFCSTFFHWPWIQRKFHWNPFLICRSPILILTGFFTDLIDRHSNHNSVLKYSTYRLYLWGCWTLTFDPWSLGKNKLLGGFSR